METEVSEKARQRQRYQNEVWRKDFEDSSTALRAGRAHNLLEPSDNSSESRIEVSEGSNLLSHDVYRVISHDPIDRDRL